MPDLHAVIPGATVVGRPTLDLDATYIDTVDLQLVRNGVSLRRRTGEGAPTWTLKLPSGRSTEIMQRREFNVVSDSLEVPTELAALVTGWVRSAPLVPVIDILSHRERFAILDAAGAEIAEIDDDLVTVEEHGAVAATFREIEVELGAVGTDAQLRAITTALEHAGAGAADPMSKVARALGPRALVPPELEGERLRRDASMGEVVIAGLRSATAAIVANDHVIRLADDPAGVHLARWGARRLRADLRTFASVLGLADVDALRAELGWLSDQLGALRDIDVLIERLIDASHSVDRRDTAEAETLIELARTERDLVIEQVIVAIDSSRYVELLDRLVALCGSRVILSAAADAAVERVPPIVGKLWRSVRADFSTLCSDVDEAQVRRMRRRVIRLRCAAEAAVPVFGAAASDLVTRVVELQLELGRFLDAVACDEWLRAHVDSDRSIRFVAGQLVAMQRDEASAALVASRSAWRRCTDRSTVSWFRS